MTQSQTVSQISNENHSGEEEETTAQEQSPLKIHCGFS